MSLRIGSLFSGCAGLDLAVEHVFGARTVWHSEIDAAPSKILAHHYPTVPNHGDVTRIDWAQVEPVDILTGGFPCQPFSAAGKRDGENDERHLWPYVLEAIRALRPKYTILENVAGLRSIGGQFDDDTPLRCVCGWTGRRGGVHYREVHKVRDRDGHPGGRGHGDEGPGSPDSPARDVWGDPDYTGTEEPAAREDHHLDAQRERGRTLPDEDQSAPNPEGRTGTDRDGDRVAADLPGENREPRPLSVDSRELDPSPGTEGSPDVTERSWSGSVGTDGTCAVCPACGRDVGDESGGPVFRSGLGTVYRDLASIGMHVRWTSIRASDVGAPHHRERIFILATPADTASVGREWGKVQLDGAPVVVAGIGQGTGGQLPAGGRPDDVLVLPTPTASDGTGGGQHPDKRVGHSRQLIDYALEADTPAWGKYASAIRRWEHHTRPAPNPTTPNRNGRPHLNAAFAEWMMGYSAGWVTDPAIGLTRGDQLKVIGNGVCPPQAVAALWRLLDMPIGVAA